MSKIDYKLLSETLEKEYKKLIAEKNKEIRKLKNNLKTIERTIIECRIDKDLEEKENE